MEDFQYTHTYFERQVDTQWKFVGMGLSEYRSVWFQAVKKHFAVPHQQLAQQMMGTEQTDNWAEKHLNLPGTV